MPPPKNSINLLLVDDEADQLELETFYLKGFDEKLRITTASSAKEALELIKTRIFDCIVSDYSMPEMNGHEFYNEIRRLSYRIPFILFTGKGNEEVAEMSFEMGLDMYLKKRPELDVYKVLDRFINNLVLRQRIDTRLSA